MPSVAEGLSMRRTTPLFALSFQGVGRVNFTLLHPKHLSPLHNALDDWPDE